MESDREKAKRIADRMVSDPEVIRFGNCTDDVLWLAIRMLADRVRSAPMKHDLYTFFIGHGMPEGLNNDEQAKWVMGFVQINKRMIEALSVVVQNRAIEGQQQIEREQSVDRQSG